MSHRILLVDDHAIVRKGIRQVLEAHPHYTVAGEAGSGEEAVQLAATLSPDLVLMDIAMSGINGLEATRRILAQSPACKVIIFSAEANRRLVDEALEAGAVGYIWKVSASDELARAVQAVLEGRLYLSPELNDEILEDYRRNLRREPATGWSGLSAQEKDLLRLVASGQRNKEIAAKMGLQPKTVEAYRARLLTKLNCSSTAELVRYAIREKLIEA